MANKKLDVHITVPQIQFTREEFVKKSNNFHVYFIRIKNALYGNSYSSNPVYKRFQRHCPDLDRLLVRHVTLMDKQTDIPRKERFNWDKLFEAYCAMSELVCEDDPDVRKADGTFDNEYLTR